MNLEKMNIGAMIKYHRQLRNMTQSELCNGICSVTHLSKFENYNKEVNQETIMLLLERLGISLDSIQRASETIAADLSDLLDAVLSYDKKRAEECYQRVEEQREYITFSNYIARYHLYLYRYFLLVNDFERAVKEQETLRQILNSLSAQEKELYEYINAAFDIIKGDYKKSLDTLLKLEANDLLPSPWQAEMYYFIALNYANLKDNSSSVAYGHNALEAYSRSFNYLRILHTQFLLGIAYTDLGLYENAAEQYRFIFRNMNLINTEELISTMYNNYALLLEKTGKFEEAAGYYLLSMEKAQSQKEYLVSLCSYTELLISLGEKEKALRNISKILVETKANSMKKQELIFRYYQYLLKDHKEKAMAFLENDVLPFLEKFFFIEDYNKFALSLAEYYLARDTDRALYYYKKIAER
ncbi:helix-turn-helix domain-containing protein [Siminovitchia fortis]|uniref:helix-turn-helix domain-containing protein n=1 Tax=Siminovitchia fortis TaxID=254758 RepID=UPI0011A9CBED|nr:helix-turn-helix transcriptional regulator [Siminovitchia fortis]